MLRRGFLAGLVVLVSGLSQGWAGAALPPSAVPARSRGGAEDSQSQLDSIDRGFLADIALGQRPKLLENSDATVVCERPALARSLLKVVIDRGPNHLYAASFLRYCRRRELATTVHDEVHRMLPASRTWGVGDPDSHERRLLVYLIGNLHLNGITHHTQILLRMAQSRDLDQAGLGMEALCLLETQRAPKIPGVERVFRSGLLHHDPDFSLGAALGLLWRGRLEAAIPILVRTYSHDLVSRVGALTTLVRQAPPEVGRLVTGQGQSELVPEQTEAVPLRPSPLLRACLRRAAASKSSQLSQLAKLCLELVDRRIVPGTLTKGDVRPYSADVKALLSAWKITK